MITGEPRPHVLFLFTATFPTRLVIPCTPRNQKKGYFGRIMGTKNVKIGRSSAP